MQLNDLLKSWISSVVVVNYGHSLIRKQREKEESEKPPETRTEPVDTAPLPASKPAAVTPPVSTAAPVSVSMDIEDNSSQDSIQQEPDIEVGFTLFLQWKSHVQFIF